MREASVDRTPGLSARLKLTLSYAGFLMIAGVLLLAALGAYLDRGHHVGLILEPSYQSAVLREFGLELSEEIEDPIAPTIYMEVDRNAVYRAL